MSTVIAGRKPVMEALRAGTQIEKVVFLQGVQGRVIEEIRELARQRNVLVSDVNRQVFRELAVDATTQGVVAVVPIKQFLPLQDILDRVRASGEPGFVIVLDEIEDPHNLGALVRTAECAGAHGVILPRHHAASISTTVVKASAGATEYVPMAEVTNLVGTIEELKSEGFWIVGLDGSGDRLFSEVDYSTPVALVIGNEGRGIRRLVKEHCDFVARIPLFGRIESLNASVAGALAMYEVARRRHAVPAAGQ